MIKKRLIYISSPYSSVFSSQVIEYLKELKKKDFFSEIILLVGIRKKNDIKLVPLEECSEFKVLFFKRYANYSLYKRIQQIELAKTLNKLLEDNTIVHVRTESLSRALYPIIKKSHHTNIKLIADVRGAVYEETLLYKKLKPVLFQLKLQQHKKNLKSLGKNTDAISCVSSRLKEYIIERTAIEKDSVFVNHCLAGKNFSYSEKIRKEYRDKMGIKEKEVLFLFSSGGDANWQNTTSTISNIADKGYKILNLSRQNIEQKNVINLFVPYNEVPKYLNAVDIAVIWRKNDIVNNVASPVKFSEYVCLGLPVIANDGVCLINEYIDKTKFGKIINNFDEINDDLISELLKSDRKEISDHAFNHFSYNAILDQYLLIYKNCITQ